jgi:ABC-type polysaccharide/polyol phosphate export permease
MMQKKLIVAAWLLLMRDYKVRFRRTLFGVLWFLFPLITLMAAILFLGKENGLYSDVSQKTYLVRIACGILFWQLMTDAWLEPMRLARRSSSLLRAVPFDSRILLFAGTLSSLIAFLIKLPVLIFASNWGQFPIFNLIESLALAITILVPAGMAMACFTLPVSLALLDARYAMPLIQYSLLLITPIFYDAPKVGIITWFNNANPFSYIIPPLQNLVLSGELNFYGLLKLSFLVLIFLIIGLYYYQSKIRLSLAYIGR